MSKNNLTGKEKLLLQIKESRAMLLKFMIDKGAENNRIRALGSEINELVLDYEEAYGTYTKGMESNIVLVKKKKEEINPHYLMQFFVYAHLPDHLKKVSKPFAELAKSIDSSLPNNPEKSTALRKLLEAKDCAVRAVLFK